MGDINSRIHDPRISFDPKHPFSEEVKEEGKKRAINAISKSKYKKLMKFD